MAPAILGGDGQFNHFSSEPHVHPLFTDALSAHHHDKLRKRNRELRNNEATGQRRGRSQSEHWLAGAGFRYKLIEATEVPNVNDAALSSDRSSLSFCCFGCTQAWL